MRIPEWDILNKLESLIHEQYQELLYEAETLLDDAVLPFFEEIHQESVDPYSMASPGLALWVDSVSSEIKDRMVRQQHFNVLARISLCCRDQNKLLVLYGASLEELIKQNPTLDDFCVLALVMKKEYQDCLPYKEGFPVSVLMTIGILMEDQ